MKLKKLKKEEKQAANLQLVKETNLTLVFNLINRHEPISRAELAQITGLSPTTISSLTEELMYNEMIIEVGMGTTMTSGRKPIMLEVNPNGGHVAAVEMVTDGFYCFLYDLKCREIGGDIFYVDNYAGIGKEIVRAIESIIRKSGRSEEKLVGICIGIPGLIDFENHRVTSSTVIPIDETNNFYFHIKDRFGDIPISLGNESSYSAYAEKEFGNAGNVKNLVFIDINVGIGSGIILDGNIFTGAFGMAGEVGHISIDMNGPKCKCGNRGCLEIMASIPAICQKLIFGVMSGRDTLIKDMAGSSYNRIGIDMVKEALDRGDRLCQEVADESAVKLAYGLNNVINLFNPEVIVIGGEITKLGEPFLEKVRQNVLSIALKPNISKVDIRYSKLSGNTVTLGGARFMLDNVFKAGLLRDSMRS